MANRISNDEYYYFFGKLLNIESQLKRMEILIQVYQFFRSSQEGVVLISLLGFFWYLLLLRIKVQIFWPSSKVSHDMSFLPLMIYVICYFVLSLLFGAFRYDLFHIWTFAMIPIIFEPLHLTFVLNLYYEPLLWTFTMIPWHLNLDMWTLDI